MRLALAVACFLAGAAHAVEDPYPWIASAYLVKRDDVVLWAGSADRRLPPPASIEAVRATDAWARSFSAETIGTLPSS